MNGYTTPPSGGDFAQAENGLVSETPYTIAQDLIARVARDLDEELQQVIEHVGHLMEQMAGFRPDRTGTDARRRLENPRLRTTYVDSRIRSLTATSLELREQLAEQVMELVKPALKLEMIEAELAAAIARRADKDAVRLVKGATGLYPAVAIAADHLHDHFGVTHWHWASARADSLRQIANILLRHDDAS